MGGEDADALAGFRFGRRVTGVVQYIGNILQVFVTLEDVAELASLPIDVVGVLGVRVFVRMRELAKQWAVLAETRRPMPDLVTLSPVERPA